MAEHTPGPWKLHDRWLFASSGPLAIASGYQDWVTAPGGSKYDEWLANAAFIVKAVNSYADLIAALGAIRLRTTPHIDDDLAELQRQMHHIAALADAAIAKVSA